MQYCSYQTQTERMNCSMDDPGPGNIILKLVILAVLILINAFFAMSEIAVIALNDNKIRRMAEDGQWLKTEAL